MRLINYFLVSFLVTDQSISLSVQDTTADSLVNQHKLFGNYDVVKNESVCGGSSPVNESFMPPLPCMQDRKSVV